jgi:hypothetical protein
LQQFSNVVVQVAFERRHATTKPSHLVAPPVFTPYCPQHTRRFLMSHRHRRRHGRHGIKSVQTAATAATPAAASSSAASQPSVSSDAADAAKNDD